MGGKSVNDMPPEAQKLQAKYLAVELGLNRIDE